MFEQVSSFFCFYEIDVSAVLCNSVWFSVASMSMHQHITTKVKKLLHIDTCEFLLWNRVFIIIDSKSPLMIPNRLKLEQIAMMK